jgi:DNA (cytosine-5)-methyltransferase 1
MNIFELMYPQIKLKPPIRLFEAFSGIGTQAMALKRITNDYEIVGYSEIDKYAIQSYHAIHGEEIKNYGDLTKMTEIPQCDIFTWSFPCTDLSKAGQRKGMSSGTRSGLVYDVLRLLSETKHLPKVLIMENVPDLIQQKFHRQFGEIQLELENMGYMNYVETLNAKHYGVAQNRDRVFMVSIIGDYSYLFPKKVKLVKRLKDYLEKDVDEKYYLDDKTIERIGNWKSYQQPLMSPETVAHPLTTRVAESDAGGMNASMLLVKTDNQDGRVYKIKDDDMPRHRIYEVKNRIGFTITTNQSQQPMIMVNEPLTSYSPKAREYEVNGWRDVSYPLFARDYKDPKVVAIPEATKKGYALAKDGDGVYLNRPHQKRGVVQDQMIQTIKANGDDIGVVVDNGFYKQALDTFNNNDCEHGDVVLAFNETVDKTGCSPTITTRPEGKKTAILPVTHDLRIRKLTPLECWRLMGIDDEDFYKAKNDGVSNSQLYKQAGNAIVVDVFEAILRRIIDLSN